MFGDPGHEHLIFEHQHQAPLTDCFEQAMMEDREIEMCFGNFGEEVAVWPDEHGPHPRCCRTLVIKADYWWNMHQSHFSLIEAIRDYIRNCPNVEKIIIQGSKFSLKSLKLVTSAGRIDSKYSAFIAGINVLKGPPVVLTCISLRGAGPTKHVITDRCV